MGAQSRGLMEPGLGHSYLRIFVTGASYDIRSADLINSLFWDTLDARRRYAKVHLNI